MIWERDESRPGEIMQMLALVIQGTRLNRRNQPDPSRSFPNKRSGRRGKMLTFVTALKYQKDNRRVSLYATLHQPSHCFLRLLFFRPTSTMLWFSQALPLTLKTWRGQSWRQQCYEITHWPPCSLRQSGPIQLHGLQRYPVIAAAAFSCNLCPRNPPTHPPSHPLLQRNFTGVRITQLWSVGFFKTLPEAQRIRELTP